MGGPRLRLARLDRERHGAGGLPDSLELGKGRGLPLSVDADRAHQGADCRQPIVGRQPAFADRRQHLKRDAERDLQAQFQRQVDVGSRFENTFQVLRQPAAGRSVRPPDRIAPFEPPATAQTGSSRASSRNALQPKAIRTSGSAIDQPLRLKHFVEGLDQVIGDGSGQRVHVVEMDVKGPLRDAPPR